MIFKRAKDQQINLKNRAVLESLNRIIAAFPVTAENFFDSLDSLLRSLGAVSGSVYVLDGRTDRYILKQAAHIKPLSVAIASHHEFVRHLESLGAPLSRGVLEKSGWMNLKAAALQYFQAVSASTALSAGLDTKVRLILNVQWSGDAVDDLTIRDDVLMLYAKHLLAGLQVERLQAEVHRLSEYTRIKQQILANLTHELKTPLSGIIGFTTEMLDTPSDQIAADPRELLKKVLACAQALNGTFSNLIDLAQIEAGRGQGGMSMAPLRPLMQEAVSLYETEAARRGDRIVLPDANEDLTACVNADQIRTVLMNLIGNAVKFTENGHIQLTLSRHGNFARIGITDTGIGIAVDQQELIFEEFYQADGSATRTFGGSGLGLAVVKKIISLHGGRIEVSSRPQEGSSFVFTLPITPL